MTTQRRGVVSVGYEGRDVDQFTDELARYGVTMLVDVRHRASSRNRGFNKTALAAALHRAGIGYRHLPSLGNPRENRAGFGPGTTADELDNARRTYAQVLDTDDARHALAELRDLAAGQIIGVLCVERDEAHCHRAVLLDRLCSAQLAEVTRIRH
jgi:uncharacterized protein (DUF488 family)